MVGLLPSSWAFGAANSLRRRVATIPSRFHRAVASVPCKGPGGGALELRARTCSASSRSLADISVTFKKLDENLMFQAGVSYFVYFFNTSSRSFLTAASQSAVYYMKVKVFLRFSESLA